MDPRTVTTDEMNEAQLLAWNALFDRWLWDEFHPSLKRMKYTQDCIDCGDIYFVVRFHIDTQGHLIKHEIVHEEIDCRNKTPEENNKLRETIFRGLSAWAFPDPLRDLIVEARMGSVTRC